MTYRIELELEDDGRWLAEVVGLRGVMAYGKSQEEALANVKALALEVIAGKIRAGETCSALSSITFIAA